MKLYSQALSPFACRVRLVAAAKGIELEVVEPPGGTLSETYKAITPFGRVPALELDDGSVLPESEIIVEYLEQTHPEPPLLPRDAASRARCRLLSRIVDIYLIQGLVPLFRKARGMKMTDEQIGRGVAHTREALGYLEGYLGDGAYAVGDELTLADCALAPFVYYVSGLLPALGAGEVIDQTPKIAAYWERLQRDPTVAKLKAELDPLLAAAQSQNFKQFAMREVPGSS